MREVSLPSLRAAVSTSRNTPDNVKHSDVICGWPPSTLRNVASVTGQPSRRRPRARRDAPSSSSGSHVPLKT